MKEGTRNGTSLSGLLSQNLPLTLATCVEEAKGALLTLAQE